MADDRISKNLHLVYSTLKSEGYTDIGDEQDFIKKMQDEQNRLKVYNALKGAGYSDMGSDFNSFSGMIYTAPQPKPQAAAAPAASPQSSPTTIQTNVVQPVVQTPATQQQPTSAAPREVKKGDGSMHMAPKQEQPSFKFNFTDQTYHGVPMLQNDEKGNPKVSGGTFDSVTGQYEGEGSFYTDWMGNKIPVNSDYGKAAVAYQQHVKDISPINAELEEAYKERDRINKMLSDRMGEIDKAENDQPWYIRMMIEGGRAYAGDKMGGAGSATDYQLKYNSDKQYRNIMSAARKNRAAIKALEDKKNGKQNEFWHAFGNAITNGYTFSQGDSDWGDVNALIDAQKHMPEIERKQKTGEKLTKDEEIAATVIKNHAWDNDVQQRYGDEYGAWARAGETAVGSLELGIDFLTMGPELKATAGSVMKLTEKGATKVLGDAATKGLGKYMTKATGVTVGSMIAGAEMSNTVGLNRTMSDVGKRSLGNVTVNEEDGSYQFDGGKGFLQSLYEAEMAAAIENGSEVLGEFLPGSGMLLKGLEKVGMKKVANGLTRLGGSTWYKNYTKALESIGFHGVGGEAVEEYAGLLGNALLVGDNKFSDLLDPKTHVDIWLGCAVTGGLLNAPRTVGYAAQGANKGYQAAQYYRYKHKTDKADAAANAVWGDEWVDLRDRIDGTSNEDMTDLATSIYEDVDMPLDKKAATLNYIGNLTAMRGYNMGRISMEREDENGRGTSDDERSLNNAFAAGYNATEQEDMEDAKNAYDMHRQLAENSLDEWTLSALDGNETGIDGEPLNPLHILGNMADSPIVGDAMTDEQRKIAADYLNAKARYDGMLQRVRDDIDSRISASDAAIDQRTNRAGLIQPATMNIDDRRVYVVDGNLVMHDDGSMIDIANSGESILVRDAETGKLEWASPHDFLSVDEEIDPAAEKEAAQAAIREQYAEEQAQKIDGALPFNDGDIYSVMEEDGTQWTAQILADNGDGTVQVAWNGNVNNPQTVSKDFVQELSTNAAMARLAQNEQERAMQEQLDKEDEFQQERPVYNLNDEITIRDDAGNLVRGSITTEENDDGQIEVYTETPINGKKIHMFTRQQIDDMLMEHNGEAVVVPEAPAITAEIDNAGAVQSEPSTVQNSVENDQETTENVPPAEETVAVEPMPMVGEGEDAEPDFGATTPQRAHDYIFNESGLEEADAAAFTKNNVEAANKELEKIKNKKPKMGTSIAKFNKDKAKWEQKVNEAQAKADYWKQVKEARDKVLAQRLAEQQERERQQIEQAQADEAAYREEMARKEAEQAALGTNNVSHAIRDKWVNAPKVEGAQDEIVLPNGEKVAGRYYLVESGAASASHDSNNGFAKTDGFPIDENGGSVNDRDYERDMDAQRITRDIANNYDSRAVQTPVVVSQDGVVLSGNGRTMAGELAAAQNTDAAYNSHIAQYPTKWGFTQQQVEGMQHPRVVFVPDAAMPYTAETFAKFNQQEMKGQSKTEQAVKLGKVVSDKAFNRIIGIINRFDTLGDFYADSKATSEAITELQGDGVLSQAQMAEMYDGDGISAIGKELLENTLIGKAFESNPNAVREITEYKSMRQSIITALAEISNNLSLGKEYSLESELAQAIDLVYQARKNGSKLGEQVSWFARQQNLDFFGLNDTVADYTNATMLMIADIINDNRSSRLKKYVQIYNHNAQDSANGQLDLFTGSVHSKEDIINEVKQLFNNGSEEEQQKAAQEAVARRKAESVQENGTVANGSEAEPAGEVTETPAVAEGVETPATEEAPTMTREKMLPYMQQFLMETNGDMRLLENMTDEELQKFLGLLDAWEEVNDTLGAAHTANDKYLNDKNKAIAKKAKEAIEAAEQLSSDAFVPVQDYYNELCDKYGIEEEAETPAAEHTGTVTEAIAAAEAETESSPTDAQKEAGNYKKGHVKVDGFDITIENAKGSTRSGKDADGTEWSVTMNNTYGYIRGTEGVDGDHIDIYLSDDPSNGNVFVIDQVKADGTFDEHKVMYGFASAEEARDNYLANYSEGWSGLGTISEVTKDEFKKWIESSHRKTKPFADYKNVKVEGAQNEEQPDTAASGPFGTIYTQFKGKAKEAIDWLKSKKEGEAAGALHHHTVGDISLVWGDAKTGLAKIVKKHPEVLDNLQDIIDSMEIVQESDNRIKLESDTHFAVVSKEYKGEPREKWLLTAYEKKETSEPANSRMDVESNLEGKSDDTATRQDSDVSGGKVTNNSSSDQENGVKSYKISAFEYTTKRGKKLNMQLAESVFGDESETHVSNENATSADVEQQSEAHAGSKSKKTDGGKSDGMLKGLTDEENRQLAELRKQMNDLLRPDGKLYSSVIPIDPKAPQKIAVGTQIAFLYVKSGVRQFGNFCSALIEDLGEEIRPYLKSIYNAVRDYPGAEVYAESMTPYDEVRMFDIANFDKNTTDAMATAEMVVKEEEVKKSLGDGVKSLSDEQLLVAMEGNTYNDSDHITDEYDARHQEEYHSEVGRYSDMLAEDGMDEETAEDMLAGVSRQWRDGGYRTSDRTKLMAQMDALEAYLQEKSNEHLDIENKRNSLVNEYSDAHDTEVSDILSSLTEEEVEQLYDAIAAQDKAAETNEGFDAATSAKTDIENKLKDKYSDKVKEGKQLRKQHETEQKRMQILEQLAGIDRSKPYGTQQYEAYRLGRRYGLTFGSVDEALSSVDASNMRSTTHILPFLDGVSDGVNIGSGKAKQEDTKADYYSNQRGKTLEDLEAERNAGKQQHEQKLKGERKQRILEEGTTFDRAFGLVVPSEIKSVDDIVRNIKAIVFGLKSKEGRISDFEGWVNGHGYAVNAGEQVREYVLSLSGVVDDNLMSDFFKQMDWKAQGDIVSWGASEYAKDDLKATATRNEREKAKVSRSRKKSAKAGEITDVGEKIAGARKDMQKEIAKAIENATVQSLIELPFSKAFKKPNLQKAIECGALREKDATFYDAWFAGSINPQKPKTTQSEMRRKKWNASYKTDVERWAESTYNSLQFLKEFIEADEEHRDAIIKAALSVEHPSIEREKAELARRKELNPDDEHRKHEWGDKWSPNPISVMYEIMQRLGYKVGDKLDLPYSVIKPNTSFTAYYLTNAKGESDHNSVATVEDAIDRIVWLAKVKRGDGDIQHPTSSFMAIPTKTEYKENGKYTVRWGSWSNPQEKEFATKEEADAFAAEKETRYKTTAYVAPVKEVARRYGYQIQFRHPLTGMRHIVSNEEFETKEDALAYLDDNFDAINDATNTQINKESKVSNEVTADDMLQVSLSTTDGRTWKYSVNIRGEYANNFGMPLPLKEGFETREAAKKYADEVKEQVFNVYKEYKAQRRAFVFFDTGDNSRVGEDYRGGRDVTGEDFMNAFGFRGVQFGNWTNQADRQMAVNQAYDALMDLSKLIGLSPKALSLNGELGIAFGARGTGNALAHYEPSEVVINLTKTRGAGSLAHEWWHALDNYLARTAGIAGGMVTDSSNIAMRSELRAAFNALTEQIKNSDYYKRSKKKGDYWGRMHEVTARLLAEWVDQSLKKRGELNTFLSRGANIKKYVDMNYLLYTSLPLAEGEKRLSREEFEESPMALDGSPYPSAREVEEFGYAMRHIFETIEEKEQDGKTALFQIADAEPYTEVSTEASRLATDALITAITENTSIEIAMKTQEAGQRAADENDGNAELMGASKRKRKMGNIAEAMNSANMDSDQKKVYNAFVNESEAEQITVTDEDGVDRTLNLVLGSENGIGVLHAIFRHAGTDSNYITSEDLLSVPSLFATGERSSGNAANRYNYTSTDENGNRTVLVTEKRGESEIFVDLYTNKKAPNPQPLLQGESQAHNAQRHTVDGNGANRTLPQANETISDAKVVNNSDTSKKNAENQHSDVEFMRVWHGSASVFEHFDSSHWLEGEGNMAYGAGHYVTDARDTGEHYAAIAQGSSQVRNSHREMLQSQIKEAKDNGWTWRVPVLEEELASIEESAASKQLYSLEIPDDNGHNYIDWNGKVDPADAKRIGDEVYRMVIESDTEGLYEGKAAEMLRKEISDSFSDFHDGSSLYGTISSYLESDMKSSELLNKLGFTGIKVQTGNRQGGDGRGMNYVIFNDADLQIKERIEFMQRPNGTVYGWSKGNRIYLTPEGVNPNTPIHEYTHLWAKSLQLHNARLWGNIKDMLKGTPVWNEVLNDPAYKTLEGKEDSIASEVLSRLSGRNGAQRMEKMAQELLDEAKGKGVMAEANAHTLIHRVRKALSDFWHWVGTNLFDIAEFKSIDEMTDRVLWDMMSGTDLQLDEAEHGDRTEFSRVTESNATAKDKEIMQEIADGTTETVYRGMQLVEIDGKQYALPPMASRVNGEWVLGVEIHKDGTLEPTLLKADEHPELVNAKGKFYLDKGNGKGLWAAYNPYWHVGKGMLNDQFAEAQDRTNLITVEGVIPTSELTDGYHADKAKDGVGAHEWKAGIIQGQLSGTREVILSRYFQGLRVVPNDEVARNIYAQINSKVDVMPTNVVPPGVRAELEKMGVQFVKTNNKNELMEGEHKGDRYTWWYGKNAEKNRAKKFKEEAKKAGMKLSEWLKENGREGQLSDAIVKKADSNTKVTNKRAKASDAKVAEMAERVNELAAKLHLDNIEIVTDTSMLEGKQKKAKGFYSRKTGKITIVVANHSDLADLEKTVLHESVAHHGLRKLFGEHFDTFLDNVFRNADADVRKHITELAVKHGWDFKVATEEYLASLAEDTNFERAMSQSWWNKIKFLFLEMLRKAGVKLDRTLRDADLRYILWRSYENLATAGEHGILKAARNEVMQQRLGVGNYGVEDNTRSVVTESVSEDEMRYRDGDIMDERDHAIVRDRYDRMMQSGMYQFREAMQDSMLSLRRLMEYISQATGEKVKDFENAYMAENALSSKNHAEQDLYGKLLFNPMLDEIHRLAKEDSSRDEVTRYMMAKHGLERNEVMAARAAKKAFESEDNRDASGNPIKSEADFLAEYRERDFGGITGLMEEDDLVIAEGLAQQLVSDFENNHDVDELWARTNACTKATLEKTYKAGLLSKSGYDEISGMYEYYIPLRGFDATTSDEVYTYLTHERSGFNSPLKKAEGRKSVADDPISTIANMADCAIVQGNKNMMKQKFLKFVMNHPSDAVSVNRMWLRYDDINDVWEAVTAQIDENDSPEEVLQKTEQFEETMQQLAAADPDHYKRGKDASNIPYKTLGKNLNEHQVHVKLGGDDYILTINGSPRAAQALNGLTNPDNDTAGAVDAILKAGEYINRQMSAFYTTRNPEFVLSNFLRDAMYANSTMWVRERPNYAVKFNKNFLKVNPTVLYGLIKKHNAGTLDMNVEIERAFYQFMMNGGETGYTVVKDIDKQKKLIKKYVRMKDATIPVEAAWKFLGDKLDDINRSVENCARFAAFLTSRQMGRSVERSVFDAKEVSVNFNKKGAGSTFRGKTDQTKLGNIGAFTSGLGRSFYVFWNAAVQGTTNFASLHKHHTGKALVLDAGMFLLGAIISGLGGGDDDDYWNLPSYVRRSNICFKIPGTDSFVSIPLGIEQRAIYGLGELFSSLASGRERMSGKEIAKEIAGSLSSMLPLDLMESNGDISWSTVSPSYVKPFVETAYNKDWKGMPIYNDTPYNKEDPEWTKASKRTNQYLVDFARWCNEITGGDEVKKGWLNFNPSMIEHVFEGVFGGVSTTANKLVKAGEIVAGKQEFDWSNILMASRVVKSADENAEARRINAEYWKYYGEYKETKRLVDHYEDQESEDIMGAAEKLNFMYNSPEYGRYEIVDDYYSEVKDLSDELNDTTNEEERKELETEINELKREMVEAIRAYDDKRK